MESNEIDLLKFDSAPSGRQFEVVEEYALKNSTARGAKLLMSWLSKGSSSYSTEMRRVFLVAHEEQATLANAALLLEEAEKRAVGYMRERDEARASVASLSKSLGEALAEVARLKKLITDKGLDFVEGEPLPR